MPSQLFVWGASTSAQQVEGQLHHNDWSDWSKLPTERSAIRQASGHYDRFAADLALAKELGHTAHRLSLEWSRLEPAAGELSPAGWQHYRDVLLELRALGLTSIVTLHHFTNPLWLVRRGGWLSPTAVLAYTGYTETVVKQLGDLIDIWLTFHDPVYLTQMTMNQYSSWPQAQRRWRGTTRMIGQLAAAHRAAYNVIHHYYPQALVGVSSPYDPLSPEHQRWQQLLNGKQDFLGLHLGEQTDLQRLLAQMPQRPDRIYITEDGLATDNDRVRAAYIRQQLRYIEAVQADGINIQGYIYRSLLDGFEWTAGFKQRYGLIAVDGQTLARTPRPSAYVYQAVIHQAQSSQ